MMHGLVRRRCPRSRQDSCCRPGLAGLPRRPIRPPSSVPAHRRRRPPLYLHARKAAELHRAGLAVMCDGAHHAAEAVARRALAHRAVARSPSPPVPSLTAPQTKVAHHCADALIRNAHPDSSSDLLFIQKAPAFCPCHTRKSLSSSALASSLRSDAACEPQLFRHLRRDKLLHLQQLALVELFRELFNGLATASCSHQHQPLHLAAQLTQVALTDLRLLLQLSSSALRRSARAATSVLSEPASSPPQRFNTPALGCAGTATKLHSYASVRVHKLRAAQLAAVHLALLVRAGADVLTADGAHARFPRCTPRSLPF